MEARRARGNEGANQMDTATHKVTYTNTRGVRSLRLHENTTEAEMLNLIQEQHALDNGVRVYSIYHADGSRCPSWNKAVA